MPEQGPCEICGNQAEYVPSDFFPGRRCPRCGEFDYDTTEGWREIRSPDEMVRLSGWVREQNAAGVVPVRIRPEISRRVTQMRLPGFRERSTRILAILARKYWRPDNVIVLDPGDITYQEGTRIYDRSAQEFKELLGISYSHDTYELSVLLQVLASDGYLTIVDEKVNLPRMFFKITISGLLAAEALGASGVGSQGFVAMSFDPGLQEVWTNGFSPAIRAAGFRPVRLDNKDYVGGITDEIMTEIRRSRFVVADYTGQRHNVYFEAGFALGLGLTVIPTCRADENDKLQFDIRHLNTLEWKSPDELAEGLNRRIRAVIGAGPDALDPP
jgi:hypothetical protein